MKIINAETKNGLIHVEHEILGIVRTIAFPIESTKEDIEESLLKLEKGRNRRAELQIENKERWAKEAKAEKTVKELLA